MDVIKDDYGYLMNFQLRNDDNSYLNISGATATFLAVGPTTITKTLSHTISESGTCSFTVGSTDFNSVGNYQWEVSVLFADKKQTYMSPEFIRVRDSL